MGDVQDTIEHIQEVVRPYLGSRENTEQVRRQLQAHLQGCLENHPPGLPLSLVDGNVSPVLDDGSTGLELEYLEAVQRYVNAVSEFQRVQNAQCTQTAEAPSKTSSQQRLDDQVLSIKLQEKKGRLELIHKYFDSITQLPTAGDTVLDLRSVFENTQPLPAVPSKIVDSFASEGNISGADLGSFIGQLDMILLKSKLLLKREAALLEGAKADSSVQPGSVSNGAKVRALDATRTKLINWIEEELTKASGEDDSLTEEGAPEDDSPEGAAVTLKEERRQRQIRQQIEKDLGGVEEKYAQYVSSRKSVVEALSRSRSILAKTIRDHPPSKEVAEQPEPQRSTAHLQIPYLESALGKLSEQRALMAHKSFLNASLGKQLRDASMAIEHLAEESQLLPNYPMSEPPPRAEAGGGTLGGATSEKPDLARRVKPWEYASESSTIAAFESIMEKIEEAQLVMLEDVSTTLDKANKLLGKDPSSGSGANGNESDIWLENEGSGSKCGRPARRAEGGKTDETTGRDIFANLKLDLGLLGRESHP